MIEIREKALRVYRDADTERQKYTPISIKYADILYYEEYAGDQLEVPEDRRFTVLFLNNGDNLVLDVDYDEFDVRCNTYDKRMLAMLIRSLIIE